MIRRRKGNSGAALLEVVAAMSITLVIGLFSVKFLAGQLALYRRYEEKIRAMSMCSQAYDSLEERLRFGCDFHVEDDRPQELVFSVRGRSRRSLKRIRAGSVRRESGGLVLCADFTGTTENEVRVIFQVTKEGTEIYRQEGVIASMYGEEETDEER